MIQHKKIIKIKQTNWINKAGKNIFRPFRSIYCMLLLKPGGGIIAGLKDPGGGMFMGGICPGGGRFIGGGIMGLIWPGWPLPTVWDCSPAMFIGIAPRFIFIGGIWGIIGRLVGWDAPAPWLANWKSEHGSSFGAIPMREIETIFGGVILVKKFVERNW